MAIFTIVGLTLTEAWRKRTLIGSLLLGGLVVALSLLLMAIRARMSYQVAHHVAGWDVQRMAVEYPNARILITLMCLFFIRILGMLFGLLLAGGAVSAEIDAGLLGVILAKPVPRSHILIGKWIGLNIVAAGSILVWTAMVWISIRAQVGFGVDVPLEEILRCGPLLALYAVMSCTLTLTFSTIFQRVLGTSLTLIIAVFAWCDGIFNFLGDRFSVPALHLTADIGGLLMPQGYVAWRVRRATEECCANPLGTSPVKSSELLRVWGIEHLHYANLDAIYVALYILAVLCVGIILFNRREIHG